MKKVKKLFASLSICLGLLFALCCTSIIFVFVYNFNNVSEELLAVAYLFIHLIILAVVFYLSFKAYLQKPQIMNILMIDENNQPIKKSKIVALIFTILGFIVGVYFTLLVFNLSIPLSFMSSGLKHALMNVGYSVALIALHFYLYPSIFKLENK